MTARVVECRAAPLKTVTSTSELIYLDVVDAKRSSTPRQVLTLNHAVVASVAVVKGLFRSDLSVNYTHQFTN